MSAYLLTWNPKRWEWDLSDEIRELKRKGFVDLKWSCGNTKRIRRGDRIFLLRQGKEPRGIMGSGTVTSPPHRDAHWDEQRRGQALYVSVRFDALVDPEKDGVLTLDRLQDGVLGEVNWGTQSSGITIPAAAAEELERRWKEYLRARRKDPTIWPDEITGPELYVEGVKKSVTVNAYERDPRARQACIEHYGTRCSVCGFSFGSLYGKHGEGFIHVHHVVPLSKIGREYKVDPVKDLRPVCPNCHAMLHVGPTVLTIEELKDIIRRAALRQEESKCRQGRIRRS